MSLSDIKINGDFGRSGFFQYQVNFFKKSSSAKSRISLDEVKKPIKETQF
jgi:hypothetical protein